MKIFLLAVVLISGAFIQAAQQSGALVSFHAVAPKATLTFQATRQAVTENRTNCADSVLDSNCRACYCGCCKTLEKEMVGSCCCSSYLPCCVLGAVEAPLTLVTLVAEKVGQAVGFVASPVAQSASQVIGAVRLFEINNGSRQTAQQIRESAIQ